MKHDELARDLANHLRGYSRPAMVWLDMQLGPAGSPRPDVYTIDCTYTRLRAMAYEVKVSRADYLRDVQAGKALEYLNYAGAVVFATPKGLITKAELPGGCGLIERGAETWRWARKPTINPLETLPVVAWQKLLMDGRNKELDARDKIAAERAQRVHQHGLQERLLGRELARLLAQKDAAKYHLEMAIQRLEKLRKDADDELRSERERLLRESARDVMQMRQELDAMAKDLGLEAGASWWQIRSAMNRAAPKDAAEILEDAARSLRFLESNATQLEELAQEFRAKQKEHA